MTRKETAANHFHPTPMRSVRPAPITDRSNRTAAARSWKSTISIPSKDAGSLSDFVLGVAEKLAGDLARRSRTACQCHQHMFCMLESNLGQERRIVRINNGFDHGKSGFRQCFVQHGGAFFRLLDGVAGAAARNRHSRKIYWL